MKISAKAEYACLAVLDLVLRRTQNEPVRVAEIAERNEIPERFLIQILLQLKGAGYVHSTRGAAGGYHLSVDPAKLSVWDVILLVEGPRDLESIEEASRRAVAWQVLNQVWHQAHERETSVLKQTTFAELAERVTHEHSPMFYI